MLAERVGNNIKRVRVARGWSLEKLASRVNPATSYQQISRLESADRPLTFEWIERIADAFKMDPIELIVGAGVQTAAPDSEVFSLSEQVANEIAQILAEVALDGEQPSPGKVQAISLILQELSATFSRYPQAYRDPAVALPLADTLARRFGPAKN